MHRGRAVENRKTDRQLQDRQQKRARLPSSSAPGRSHWEAQEPAAPGAPPVSPARTTQCPWSLPLVISDTTAAGTAYMN